MIKDLTVDYAKKQAVLTYSIPETSSMEITVFDAAGALLDTVVAAEKREGGEHTLIYDFSNEEAVTALQRYFKLVARDRAKNTAEKTTQTFAIVPNQFQIANHQAVPAAFTPNGDGHSDRTKITYQISGGEPDYKVTIDILTTSGSTLKRLIENEKQTNLRIDVGCNSINFSNFC